MPIYEYICANCGQELEVIQKFSDASLKECPECKELSLDKKTSVSAFHLKGGGWYKDGYGTSNSSAEPKPAVNSDSNSDKKNAPKPAAETKAKTPNKTVSNSKAS